MSQFPRQLMHHLLEDHRVHVLAQHIEQEPVSNIGLLDDGVDDLPPDEPEPDVEKVGSHLRAEDNDQSVEDNKETQDREKNKPEKKTFLKELST